MSETKVKKIGVLTSGGDAPGMNVAIRSVVRTAVDYDIRVVGINHGYEGLLHGDIQELGSKDVSSIMNRGGTILHTARSEEMRTPEGVEKMVAMIRTILSTSVFCAIWLGHPFFLSFFFPKSANISLRPHSRFIIQRAQGFLKMLGRR